MNKHFTVGDLIQISKDYHWAGSATGEIIKTPDYILEIATGWENNMREVKALHGILYFYWVKFDEPQIDADGDGPYGQAEIDSNFMTLFPKNN
jgi:hypothetical protein